MEWPTFEALVGGLEPSGTVAFMGLGEPLLHNESLASIWAMPDYAAFRDRVLRFDFPPCTDCGCDLAESNEEDCFGNPHPTCGDCLWARGIVRCA